MEVAAQREMLLLAMGRPEFDVENARSIAQVVRAVDPSAIVNAAAYTAVDQAQSEPERAFAVNRDGARLLALEAQSRKVPFIYVSTDYVFDGGKSSPYLEEDAPAPLNVYGRSKLEGEAPSSKLVPVPSCFEPPGSTAPMAKISSGRCCGSPKRKTMFEWSTISGVRRRPRTIWQTEFSTSWAGLEAGRSDRESAFIT
jgi:RmlD substrate binding domain